MTALIQSAAELGLIGAITVLALYLSYSMLNVCDLSTDGAFTLGAATGAVVALAGHPYLSIPAAMAAGMLSGLVTALLQTKMGIDSLLSGIIVNTGLYSVNIAVMGNTSQLNMVKTDTVFTKMKNLLAGTGLESFSRLIVIMIFVIVVSVLMVMLFKTRLGLLIRATGNNQDMVRSVSVSTQKITIIGLCLSNSLTGLSGCLLAQYNKSVNIDIGTGMVTIALASLLIGRIFSHKRRIAVDILAAVTGAIIFRLVYTLALRLNMPAHMLKLISAVIVIIAISGPYLLKKYRDAQKTKKLLDCRVSK